MKYLLRSSRLQHEVIFPKFIEKVGFDYKKTLGLKVDINYDLYLLLKDKNI